MEAKAKALGIGGKMRYVYPNGHNYGALSYAPSGQVALTLHCSIWSRLMRRLSVAAAVHCEHPFD
eukprot:SAG31_NODE_1043_length_10184_cov_2.174517_3_plen_65_part_00